jgi:hypothetical protein
LALFTQLPRGHVPRSSHPGTCISRSPRPGRGDPQALASIQVNATSCGGGWICTMVNARDAALACGGGSLDARVPKHLVQGTTVPRHAGRGVEGRVGPGLAVTRPCRGHVTWNGCSASGSRYVRPHRRPRAASLVGGHRQMGPNPSLLPISTRRPRS